MLIQSKRLGESEGVRGEDWRYVPPAAGYTNSTADVPIKAAVAGKRNYVEKIYIAVSTSLANVSVLEIKSASTVLHRVHLPVTFGPTEIKFDRPLIGGVNEAINIAAAPIFATGVLGVNAEGYTV